VKTSVIANNQQVVLMDEEETHPVSKHRVEEILGTVEALLAFCDCVILSDYAKGFVTSTLATTLLAMARKVSVPVIVDPKGADAIRYRGATVIKPNRSELSLLTGLPVRSHADTLDACEQLSSALPGIVILATEGAGGMTLRLPDGTCIHLPARALEVFDVTGAGDTVIAVAGIAIGSGADFRFAAQIANCAAGIVVGEFGCAEVSLDRLTAEITKPRFNVQTRRDSCQPVVAAASKPAS
jgi:D-beta-D-heptose 7-phosphate kinase/D-beta-D-heptose 1-phosphate adenosyltransferase